MGGQIGIYVSIWCLFVKRRTKNEIGEELDAILTLIAEQMGRNLTVYRGERE